MLLNMQRDGDNDDGDDVKIFGLRFSVTMYSRSDYSLTYDHLTIDLK